MSTHFTADGRLSNRLCPLSHPLELSPLLEIIASHNVLYGTLSQRRIYKAWFSRRSVTTETVGPLSCYREEAPYEKRGLIELDPKKCDRESTCCLAASLRSMKDDLEKLKTAIDEGGSIREEDRRRAKALRHVYRTKAAVTDEVCRHLGDAVIVAYAPRDATILTTNLKDHTLLANAIGRTVASPRSVIEMAKSGG